MVSMRILSARDGYKYLLPIVAAVDDDRSLSTALACCYAEAGTPPPAAGLAHNLRPAYPVTSVGWNCAQANIHR